MSPGIVLFKTLPCLGIEYFKPCSARRVIKSAHDPPVVVHSLGGKISIHCPRQWQDNDAEVFCSPELEGREECGDQ